MKTTNLFKIAISMACFAFFLLLAGGSDSSSTPSSSPRDSYEEPVTEPETTTDEEDEEEDFVPVNEGTEMPEESDEIEIQENGTEE